MQLGVVARHHIVVVLASERELVLGVLELALQVQEILVKRRGDVRRAKLYYLRDRTGKAARIKEKI